MGFRNLEAGDIILFSIRKGSSSKAVAVAQAVTRINPFIAYGTKDGSVNTGHAAIVIQDASSNYGYPKIAHAVDTGCISQSFGAFSLQGAAAYSSVIVYRPKAILGDAIFASANTAKQWTTGRHMKYASAIKVMKPGFHQSGYGSGAKERCSYYSTFKDRKGGPPGFHHARKTMFCSTFVIAAYQAVLGVSQSATHMALDARYTSPMKLESYLANNGTSWELMPWVLNGYTRF